MGVTAFFTNMWNDLLTRDTVFSQPKNMTTSMIRHLRIFGRHIYKFVQVYTGCNQMHQTYVLFLRILSESMPALPQQEGEGQHRTRMFVSMLCTTNQHVLNIQLTDMWYLDISSLALMYIYLSRITNNFGIDQLKISLNKPISMVDILNKKSFGRKTIWSFFPDISHQKRWFLDRINSVPRWPRCNRFCWVSKIGHKCIITTISNCSCSMNFYNGFQASTTYVFKTSIIWKIHWFLTW